MQGSVAAKSRRCLCWVLLSSASFAAELKWQTTEETVNLDQGIETATLSFSFENRSHATIPFPEVIPSCECISVSKSADAVAPFETGRIAVVIRPDRTEEPTRQKLSVRSGDDFYSLRLVVNPRIWFRLSHPLLKWGGNSFSPQEVEVTGDEVASVQLGRVDPRLAAEVVGNADGKPVKIRVKIVDPKLRGFASVGLAITRKDGLTAPALVVASAR